MSFKNYDDALDWLFQVRRFGSKLGLDYVRYLLEQLGNPHIHFKSIHVTGTNGKGSTTAMIASILKAAGYRVGMFTSPHLISFTERIQVDGVQISPSDVMRLIEEIKPFIDDMNKNPDLRHPTFFEIITAMAFSYFAECSVDFAVLEVGMGGELDATNVVHALVSVVTNVSLEHTEVLGDTVLEIAEKKGGIIKSGGVLITATEDDSVYSLLSQMCRDRMSKIFRVGSDVKYEAIRSTIDGQSFNLVGLDQEYNDIFIPLKGRHQLVNAATAIAAYEALSYHGLMISEKAILEGLKNVYWPGRLEVMQKKPLVVLDGAKDVEAAKAAINALDEFSYTRLTTIVSMSSDKKIEEMMEAFAQKTDLFILTAHSVMGRAAKTILLADIAEKLSKPYRIISEVKEAVDYAINNSGENDMVLVIGSVFLVGEAREIWYPAPSL